MLNAPVERGNSRMGGLRHFESIKVVEGPIASGQTIFRERRGTCKKHENGVIGENAKISEGCGVRGTRRKGAIKRRDESWPGSFG